MIKPIKRGSVSAIHSTLSLAPINETIDARDMATSKIKKLVILYILRNCITCFVILSVMTSKKKYSLIYDVSLALFTAVNFSAFIYFEHYGLTCKIINSVTALVAYALLLHVRARVILFSGFFIGLFWFYWIGYSFEYYHYSQIMKSLFQVL